MSGTSSRYVNGNIVYYDKTGGYQRWLDAFGPNVIKYVNHFINLSTDDTTGDPTEWTTTLVEAGAGESTVTIGQASGGILLITTDANEDDGAQIQLKGESFKFISGYPVYFGIRFKVSEATQNDFIAGLCITDTTLLGGMTDGVYFRSVDASAAVSLVLEKNSTETTGAVLTAVADTYYVLEFYYDGTNVDSWVDGVQQTRLAMTNLCDDEELTPSIALLAGSAAINTMTVDWIRCFQILA